MMSNCIESVRAADMTSQLLEHLLEKLNGFNN